jgi:alpha-tubulin suppressor-like RCC1 family protein
MLGDGTTTNRSTSVAVSGLTNVAQIDTSDSRYGSDDNDHTCAVKTDGTLWCWGLNSSGQLGDGTTTSRYTPVQARFDDNEDNVCDGNMTGVAKVSTGGFATCVLTTTGTMRCMGFNHRSITTESTTDRRCLVRTRGIGGSGYLGSIVDMEIGDEWQAHVLAVDSNGKVITWGDNEAGNLGYNSLTDRSVPGYAHGF